VIEQLGRVHEPVAVLDQVSEQREHLRLDVAKLAASTQLAAREVELPIAEHEYHGRRSAAG